MPYAPAFMRRAPPTVPGTPMSPSIPPRSFFAQKVIMRPRSAAASTWARLPSSTTSGSGRTSCRTTQGSSPSPTSRFEPPPRHLCGTCLLEQEFNAFLHRAKIVDVLVAGLANGARKRFTRHAWDGRFAGRIDVEQHEDIRLIEGAAEFVPKELGACVAMRLKEHEQAIELAAAGRFERDANLGRVMTVVIDHGDLIDHALDVKSTAHAGKFEEAFADQASRNV